MGRWHHQPEPALGVMGKSLRTGTGSILGLTRGEGGFLKLELELELHEEHQMTDQPRHFRAILIITDNSRYTTPLIHAIGQIMF